MEHIKLSPSSISVFRDCPLCFWLEHARGIKRPDGIFPSLPSGMDRIFKNNFDSFRGKGLPPELFGLDGIKLFDDMKLLGDWRNNRRGIIYHDKTTDAVLKGVIDEILMKDGKFIILDFKTRGYPLKEDTHKYYQGQLDFYTYLLEMNGHETEHYGYLLFYYPDKIVGKGVIVFDTKLVRVETFPKNAEKMFRDAIECIRNPEPPNASSGCEYCRYFAGRSGMKGTF